MDYKEIVGRNISGSRGRLQLSQTIIAARMRHLGFEYWQQQTVAVTEKGKRRLTIEEVFGLAVALECTLPALLLPISPGSLELPAGSGQALDDNAITGLIYGGPRPAVDWPDA